MSQKADTSQGYHARVSEVVHSFCKHWKSTGHISLPNRSLCFSKLIPLCRSGWGRMIWKCAQHGTFEYSSDIAEKENRLFCDELVFTKFWNNPKHFVFKQTNVWRQTYLVVLSPPPPHRLKYSKQFLAVPLVDHCCARIESAQLFCKKTFNLY